MIYPIRFTNDAANDLRRLDSSIQKQVIKKLSKLEENPFLGKKLENKQEHNLRGLFKLYVYSKSYRLITPTEIEIIEIVGIGKRDKGEVYQTIIKHILDTTED